MTRRFLRDDDLSPAEQHEILQRARHLKSSRDASQPFHGAKAVALIFDKPTLRTQVSFAAGVAELGGMPMVVDGNLAQIGTRESDLGHRQGARPAGRGDRVAHVRPGTHRGDGGVRRGARSSMRSPTSSTPASCSPTCSP